MAERDERDPRVYFAIERTFLAWTRTALALMTFGFVIARLGIFFKQMQGMAGASPPGNGAASPAASLWIGTAIVVLGAAIQGLSLREYQQLRRKFLNGEGVIGVGLPLPHVVGTTLLAAGIGLTVYLVTLR